MSLIITRGFGQSGVGLNVIHPLDGDIAEVTIAGFLESSHGLIGEIKSLDIDGEIREIEIDGEIESVNIEGDIK